MKHIKLFEQFISSINEGIIDDKDWQRMADLIASKKDGAGVAKTIKNKNKAIARFIAGAKLSGDTTLKNDIPGRYRNSFSEFGERALELGATPEEIEDLWNKTEPSEKHKQWISNKIALGYGSIIFGDIAKAIDKSGYKVTIPNKKGYATNGNAVTLRGKDAMARNGRKWTIGYKLKIDKDGTNIDLVFDAITDEGGGSTYYVFGEWPYSFDSWESMGKNEFIKKILDDLKK